MAVSKNALKAGLQKPITPNLDNSPLAVMLGVPLSSGQITEVPINQLDTHPEQIHYSMSESELEWLSNNIAEVGVIDPIHIRPIGSGRYTILAGHRRTEAARRAGQTTIKAIIDDVDDATATVIFNATNLGSRQKLLPSEKAYGYLEMEKALVEKARTNGPSISLIAQLTGDSIKQIYRYKRLNQLVPALLKKVDNEIVPFRAGVELSYLSLLSQAALLEALEELHMDSISLKQAEALHTAANTSGDMNVDEITGILSPPKEKKPRQAVYKLSKERISAYLPDGSSEAEAEELIVKALQQYVRSG